MIERVIFDTSTLIGAAIRVGSKPYQALMLSLESYTICVSQQLLAELREAIHRARLDKYITTDERREFLDLVQENFKTFSVLSSENEKIDPPCRDPKDNFILVLALAAQVDLIISSDHDLLVLNPWRGIPIVTPAEFVKQYSL